MGNAVIIERIRERYPGLTANQKRLADYIVSSYHEAAFLTASELARRVGMDESTVVRFAQRLGYRGYPEMMHAIRDALRRDLAIEDLTGEPAGIDALAAQVHAQVEALAQMVGRLSAGRSLAILEALSRAERIYILGQGLTSPLAQLLAYGLRMQGLMAESPPSDTASLAVWLRGAGAGTVVMAISIGDEDQPLANALAFAREQGAGTVGLCCSAVSPCALAAESALSCTVGDRERLPEISALALIIEALLYSVGTLRAPEESDALARELGRAREGLTGGRRRSS